MVTKKQKQGKLKEANYQVVNNHGGAEKLTEAEWETDEL